MKKLSHEKVAIEEGLAADAEAFDRRFGGLILRVGRDRDEAAFDEIYEQFKTPIYNLARYLVRDKEAVLEVVQDVMLAIWNAAPSFQPGPVKGWIYRITSRKCISYNRSCRRGATSLRDVANLSADGQDVFVDVERQELLNALREAVKQLDCDDRTLVVLYFGAGLSQQEIATQIAVSQRTISTRLEEAVRKLRAAMNLGRRDSMPSAALVALFGETLQSGPAVPTQIHTFIFNKIKSEDMSSHAVSSGKRASVLYFSGLIILAMVVVGFSMGFLSSNRSASSINEGVLSAEPLEDAKFPGRRRGEWPREWDFRNGMLEGFVILSGNWGWKDGDGKKPAGMVSDKNVGVLVTLPISRPACDFVIETELYGVEPTWTLGSMPCDMTDRISCLRHAVVTGDFFLQKTAAYCEIFHGRKQYSFAGKGMQLRSYKRYDTEFSEKILLGYKGAIIKRIKVRALTTQEATVVSGWENNAVRTLKAHPTYHASDVIFINPVGHFFRDLE